MTEIERLEQDNKALQEKCSELHFALMYVCKELDNLHNEVHFSDFLGDVMVEVRKLIGV